MRKQEQEALRRLEAALMEQERPKEIPLEEDEAFWQELNNIDCDVDYDIDGDVDYDVYNTDDTDVDLDDYSEDVHRGSQSNSFVTVFMIFSLLLLAAAIFILLRFLGVI